MPGSSPEYKSEDCNICNVTIPIIDSSSAVFGYVLTYVYYLLKDKFDEMDINIGKRFKFEIERRITKPFLESDDKWMKDASGIYADWIPGCISNILFPFLIFEEDYKVRHKAIRKSMLIVDSFISDKARDELPEYNSHIYEGLISYLDLLYMASGGVFDIFEEELIHKIGESAPKPGNIGLLQYISHTGSKRITKLAYRDCCGSDYINRLKDDLPISQSLFLIFNYDLIMNEFYLTEGGVEVDDEVADA